MLITYQDYLSKERSEKELIAFVKKVIENHKSSDLYKTAEAAEAYLRHENPTITQYKKMLTTISGQLIPDEISPNYKMATGKFKTFVTQEVQYLLGNGASFGKEETKDKIGTKRKDFDRMLQKAAKYAIAHAVSFGLWNRDHVDVFNVLEFAPIYDEENGSLCAGVRFWRIDKQHPMRATFYELDGYTEFIWRKGKGSVYQQKRKYILKYRQSEADGREIYDGINYPSFPIVPFWGNAEHTSKLTGLREQIDCYDLIKSGFANNIDEASLIYWTIKNAGGMDDVDLAEFLQRIRTLHVANVNDGEEVQANALQVPTEARDTLLDRLDRDMYKDAMAFNPEKIAAGAVTATQIKASYQDLDELCDEFEYCVLDFVNNILDLAGIDDEVTFTRSRVINVDEYVGTLVAAGEYLPNDYVTRKILEVLGDGDKADEIIDELTAEETNAVKTRQPEDEQPEENPEEQPEEQEETVNE